jgi:hypothetical protein
VLPVPHVPDGLTIRLLSAENSGDGQAPNFTYRITGKAERFTQTALREWAYA